MAGPPKDDRYRCSAKSKKTGERCKAYRVRGSTVCANHGVGHRGAPQRRFTEVKAMRLEAEREAQRMVARAGVDADPIEHLLDSLYRAAALVQVWGQMVADLDNKGEVEAREQVRVRGWAEREFELGPDDKVRQRVVMDPLMVQTSDKTVQLHPFVKEYHEALDRRAKFAKLCADAGVERRQIELKEAQAQLLAQCINGLLNDLGLTAEQAERAPGLVRQHLQALPSEAG